MTTKRVADPEDNLMPLLVELDEWFVALRRAMIGFNTLRLSYLSLSGQLAEGERVRGLPFFEFNGVMPGKEKSEVVKCVVDLKKVDPLYHTHILLPLIGSYAAQMKEALDEVADRLLQVQPILDTVIAKTTPLPAQQE